MKISLTMPDLLLLAANSELEKHGVTVTLKRPVLSTITAGPHGLGSTVLFFIDESDPRARDVI
ncbi:MAG TPA: hypothetical protein VGR96_12405, partial [Acidobacteriaceae bacterium]|nr:hypothetical protein [Acidobacteriaceae bacterium]